MDLSAKYRELLFRQVPEFDKIFLKDWNHNDAHFVNRNETGKWDDYCNNYYLRIPKWFQIREKVRAIVEGLAYKPQKWIKGTKG